MADSNKDYYESKTVKECGSNNCQLFSYRQNKEGL